MSMSTTMLHDVKVIHVKRGLLPERGPKGERRYGIDINIETDDGLVQLFAFPAQDRLEVFFDDDRQLDDPGAAR